MGPNRQGVRLSTTDKTEVARRERRRPADRPTAHRAHPQVIHITRRKGGTAKPGREEWSLLRRPAEELRIGESVFVSLADDTEGRGLEEPLTIIGISKERPCESGNSKRATSSAVLLLVSSEMAHQPILLHSPALWVDDRRGPARAVRALRNWKEASEPPKSIFREVRPHVPVPSTR